MRCASPVIARRLCALAVFVALAGCGELWPLQGQPRCEEYSGVIQPLLTQRCVECHGPALAEGGYRLDSRDFAVARRADGTTRFAEPSPAVLQAASGALTGHQALDAAEQATLTAWVTACRAGPGPILWHPRGWVTPGDESSHATVLRGSGYELMTCKECHGEDLTGGTSKVACTTCHEQGPFECQTCHGTQANAAPPKSLSGATLTSTLGVGAHQSHVTDGPLHAAYGCEVCHVKVTDVWQNGHFRRDGQAEDGIAEVELSRADDGGAPAWDREAATCTNTACHAPLVDTTATLQQPVWTLVDGGQATCGACHGLPPAGHSTEPRCTICHVTALADGGVVASLHADGVVQVGRLPDGTAPATVTCGSCHWDGTGPARDTLGRTDTTLTTVGMHAAHVQGRRHLTAPIGCNECHLVPVAIRDVGHIDTEGPAEVFPAASGVGARARADGAQPTWNASNATCSDSYCHGGGTLGATDTSPGKQTTMTWTSPFPLTCGSCHGAPPNTAIHDGGMTLGDCATCHPSTISPLGNMIVTVEADGGVTTAHLNGTVEHTP